MFGLFYDSAAACFLLLVFAASLPICILSCTARIRGREYAQIREQDTQAARASSARARRGPITASASSRAARVPPRRPALILIREKLIERDRVEKHVSVYICICSFALSFFLGFSLLLLYVCIATEVPNRSLPSISHRSQGPLITCDATADAH